MSQVYLEYLGDSIELPIGETVVGRDVGCMLRFNDPAVSRRHLRFIRREDELFVEDLQSANGTLLNGRRVTSAIRLREGDVIHVGTRELTIRLADLPSVEASTLSLQEIPQFFRDTEPAPRLSMARATTKIAVTVPPPMQANQRCPRCGAAVSAEDDACAGCQYAWGDFRPMTPTLDGINPLVKRRHERHPIELHLIYISSELEIEVSTRDLSVSGVFVRSNILDPIGTQCRLTILIDGGPAIEISGVVRRVVDRREAGDEFEGLGIEFVDVQASQRASLQSVVDRAQADDSEA